MVSDKWSVAEYSASEQPTADGLLPYCLLLNGLLLSDLLMNGLLLNGLPLNGLLLNESVRMFCF
jgi:hypothetical protein